MDLTSFWQIKDEIPCIGFDDGPFEKNNSDKSVIVGAVFRGGKALDGVLTTKVNVDGIDATDNLIYLLNSSRQKKKLRIIFLDGITLAGLNVINIKKLYEETGLPVIAIMRQMPNLKEFKMALTYVENASEKWQYVKNAGNIFEVETKKDNMIYFQTSGLSVDDAIKIIKITSTRSLIPEPLRVAHIIASGIVTGDSKGGA